MSRPLHPGDPRRLGDYELLGRLGEGGMGTVFQGRAADGQLVAIKMVRTEFAHDDEFLRRFRSEVNRARQVPPFSTAEVLDADPDHEPPYLVVEFVDGPSLAAVVRDRGPLRGAALHGVAVGIATALTAIHGAGVIHRDLKPANVLMAMGGVKVIDFGIARPTEMTSRHTRTDQMVGTIAYMAPERFDTDHGDTTGFAADIFAWGAVVAFAATGRTPFAADSAPATAMRILTQPPRLTGLDEPLRSIVERTLVKDPAARPSARELLDLLLAAQGAPDAVTVAAATGPAVVEPVVATPPGGVPPPVAYRSEPERRRRRRTWLVAATAVCTLAAAGGGLYLSDIETPSSSAPAPNPSAAPVSPSAPAGLPGILAGERRTLLHMASIDRDLALPQNDPARAGGGTTPESVFVLIPRGKQVQIKSMVGDLRGAERCLGVEPTETASADLVPTGCAPSAKTLFTLSATGERDEKERPVYSLFSDEYGAVQWSETKRRIYVEQTGDFPNLVAFSFVDRGPV